MVIKFKERVRIRFIFTMIELLMVIAIITILSAVLLPALSKARDKSKELLCRSNLKQIGAGIYNYANDFSDFTYPGTPQSTCTGINDWINDKVKNWYDNKLWQCPSVKKSGTPYISYAASYGEYMDYIENYYGRGLKLFKLNPRKVLFCDKTEHLVVEVFSSDSQMPTGSSPRISMRHNQGTNCLYVDGHVEWLRYNLLNMNTLNPN
ncbi:MAG: hypothetical protein A2017_21770 [Lentisphaerae bacterium GWF2_44_16]|nr:MAG: hypothetical protein A2017_21770 [Lentisphaerae bacterium GWF2_44_16]